MKKNEIDKLRIKAPEMGPKFKEWREANNIPIEQAAEYCGVDIETIQTIENGENFSADLLGPYHSFFFENIPNAKELYSDFMDEVLAKHGYTYDEEGNEHYEKPSED